MNKRVRIGSRLIGISIFNTWNHENWKPEYKYSYKEISLIPHFKYTRHDETYNIVFSFLNLGLVIGMK